MMLIVVLFFKSVSSFGTRPGNVFVYPTPVQHPDASEDCYDMPRSLHQTLVRQESSNYQAPRSHRPLLSTQSSLPDAAMFADYDVPRPHNPISRMEPLRTPSVDSRFVFPRLSLSRIIPFVTKSI